MSPAGDTGTSSTPPRANAAAHPASKIESTPNSRGAAVISEHISLVGAQVDQVSPWIQRDIQESKTSKADDMLQVLLQRASCDKETEQPHLLETCLKAVLPVCNGRAAASAAKGKRFHSSAIKTHLKTYQDPGHEDKYYAPFIKVTNIALACLQEIKVDGMSLPVSAVDMICQQNDFPMLQSHQTEESIRKPDVVFLPLQSSLKAFPDDEGIVVDDHGVTNATDKPQERLLWKDVLACIEFKRKTKKLRLPPSSYEAKEHVTTNPDHLPVDPPKPDNQTPARASGPSQIQASQPASDPTLRRSNRIAASRAASQPASSAKRKAQEQLGSESKRGRSDYNPPDVTVQTGLYAAEMFAANLAVNHLLNFIVIDDVIWVWYYDRQGTIQNAGINFIQDLPRFMVLLYALQRFKLDDWGRNKDFLPVEIDEQGYHKVDIQDEELGTVDLLLHSSDKSRVTHYGLQGRATNVVPVTSKVLAKKHQLGRKDEMVAKIFWGEENRTSEPEILKKVKEIAEEHESVKGHIPDLLWHHKFTNPTSAIRKALGLPEPTTGSRVLYILIFRKLNPITELHGKDLFDVWRQCILCHILLWKEGVYHRDVSPGNMMWYRDKLGRLMGVLNDYDLSSLANVPGPQGNERTGTVPFMALDLLTPEGQQGEVKHLYRHDLESFMWVLAWVFLRYRNGVLLPPASRPLDEWATSAAPICYEKKSTFLTNLKRYQPSDIDCSYANRPNINPCMWGLLVECFGVLDDAAHDRRVDGRRPQQGSQESAGQQTNAEESNSDMDSFLLKFTTSDCWVELSNLLQ